MTEPTKKQLLANPFYTDSASKAYEQSLRDVVDWIILHNKAYEFKEFALGYPLALSEDDFWALRKRVGNP